VAGACKPPSPPGRTFKVAGLSGNLSGNTHRNRPTRNVPL
jgi:hypothetical protein